ncbi:MAG: serine/threonine-protein kinase [Pseudomonadota bacterium]
MTKSTNFAALVPKQKLDRYELLRPLARGGMAELWLARLPWRHGFRKRVVIKAMLPEFAGKPLFRRMFLDEAKVASRIEHPNVAHVFDFGEAKGRLYIVMEWVEGISLAQLQRALKMQRVQLPLALALRITSELSAALHAVHELRDDEGKPLGVVHRDVSPENVLLAKDGSSKLIDFGIVKTHCDRLIQEISAGGFKGKFGFAAPEQALGLRIDRRADVWAVGAVLFRLLTQRAPFAHDGPLNPIGILAAYRECAPLPRSIPASVAQIVARALAISPEHRFDSCDELHDALEAAMVSEQQHATRQDLAAFVAGLSPASRATLATRDVVPPVEANDEDPTRKLPVRRSLIAGMRADVSRSPGWIALAGVSIASVALLVLGISIGASRAGADLQRAPDGAANFAASLGQMVAPARATVPSAGVAAEPCEAAYAPLAESNAVAVDRLPLEDAPRRAQRPRRVVWHQPHRKQVVEAVSVATPKRFDPGF